MKFYPHYAELHPPPFDEPEPDDPSYPRENTRKRAAPDGPLYVGSPQEIVDKIPCERELFGHHRLLGQIDIGGLPFAKVARVTELFAAKVAPVIRGAVGR